MLARSIGSSDGDGDFDNTRDPTYSPRRGKGSATRVRASPKPRVRKCGICLTEDPSDVQAVGVCKHSNCAACRAHWPRKCLQCMLQTGSKSQQQSASVALRELREQVVAEEVDRHASTGSSRVDKAKAKADRDARRRRRSAVRSAVSSDGVKSDGRGVHEGTGVAGSGSPAESTETQMEQDEQKSDVSAPEGHGGGLAPRRGDWGAKAAVEAEAADMRERFELPEHEHAPLESEVDDRESKADGEDGAHSGRDEEVNGDDDEVEAAVGDEYERALSPSESAALEQARRIASHGPLLTQVPYSQRHTFQECAAVPFAALLRARGEKSHAGYMAALVQLLRLPDLILRPPVAGGATSVTAEVKRRMREYLEEGGDGGALGDDDAGRRADKRSQQEKAAARARKFLSHGAVGKAARALMDEPPMVVTPEVLEKLREKNPAAPPGEEIPDLPDHTAPAPIALPPLRAYLRRLPTCSGAGPSGWTYELMQDLIGNKTCEEGLAALLHDIHCGMSREAGLLLLSCRLIAGSTKGKTGPRPITVGEAFYRAAAGYRMHEKGTGLKAAMREAVGMVQLGVAVSGGAEIAVHCLQAWAEDETNKRAILGLDFQNAFNSVYRSAVFKELFAQPELESLFRISHFAYSHPTPLFVKQDGTDELALVWSANGVRQGDPLASLLFSLAARPVYEAVLACAAGVQGVAFIDDLNLATPVEHVRECIRVAQSEGAPRGLKLQLHKTTLLLVHSDVVLPGDTRRALDEMQATVVGERWVKALGAPVGGNLQAMRAAAQDVVSKHATFFEQLLSPHLTTQEASLLLRVCAVPRMSYLLRAARPGVTWPAAQAFEEMVLNTAAQLFGLEQPLSEQQVSQLELPIRFGGFGLGQSRPSVSWYAAQAMAAEYLRQCHAGDTRARQMATQRAAEKISTLCGAKAAHLLPAADSDVDPLQVFADAPELALKVQSTLTRLVHEDRMAALQPPAEDKSASAQRTRAWLSAVRAPKASTWLTMLPTGPATRLSDDAFSMAARHRLQAAPDAHMPDFCPVCKDAKGDLQLDAWHALSCGHLRPEHTRRHDAVVSALATWARTLGARVKLEPRNTEDRESKRQDLKISLGPKRYLVDVVISHPLCSTHVAHAARSGRPLAVAEQAAREKRRKHEGEIKDKGATFVPFSLESFGGMGADAAAFIKQLIGEAKLLNYRWAPRETVYGIIPAVSAAVQRGNARAVHACINRAHGF